MMLMVCCHICNTLHNSNRAAAQTSMSPLAYCARWRWHPATAHPRFRFHAQDLIISFSVYSCILFAIKSLYVALHLLLITNQSGVSMFTLALSAQVARPQAFELFLPHHLAPEVATSFCYPALVGYI